MITELELANIRERVRSCAGTVSHCDPLIGFLAVIDRSSLLVEVDRLRSANAELVKSAREYEAGQRHLHALALASVLEDD